MAITIRDDKDTVRGRDRAEAPRTNAVVAGVLLVVATTTSLLSGPFLAPVTGAGYLTDADAHHTQVATGVLLGLIAALAAPGIAIALYPVLRRFGAGLALGAVALRVVEGTFYALGLLVLWSLSTLSRDFVSAGAPRDPHYATLGHTLLAQYHGLADVGLLLAFGLGGLAYYVVFFRSRLIPRWLSVWGIVGVVLLMVAAVLVVYGVVAPLSAGQVALAAPIGLQEMVLAVWLIVKGFDRHVLAQRESERS